MKSNVGIHEVIQRLVRVAHNFIDVRNNKGAPPSTAAMRIGLAEAPVSYGDVVYFK